VFPTITEIIRKIYYIYIYMELPEDQIPITEAPNGGFPPTDVVIWANVLPKDAVTQKRGAFCGIASAQSVECAVLRQRLEKMQRKTKDGKKERSMLGPIREGRKELDSPTSMNSTPSNVDLKVARLESKLEVLGSEQSQFEYWLGMRYFPKRFFYYWGVPDFDLPCREDEVSLSPDAVRMSDRILCSGGSAPSSQHVMRVVRQINDEDLDVEINPKKSSINPKVKINKDKFHFFSEDMDEISIGADSEGYQSPDCEPSHGSVVSPQLSKSSTKNSKDEERKKDRVKNLLEQLEPSAGPTTGPTARTKKKKLTFSPAPASSPPSRGYEMSKEEKRMKYQMAEYHVSEILARAEARTLAQARHMLISHCYRTGIPLENIGEVLRQRSDLTTQVIHWSSDPDALNTNPTSPLITIDEFRRLVCDRINAPHYYVIVNYSRKHLSQPGAGHISLLGAYNRTRDLVLLYEPNANKYPPHWAPVYKLYAGIMTEAHCSLSGSLWRGILEVYAE